MSIHAHEITGKHRGDHTRMHTGEIREIFSSIIGHLGVSSTITHPDALPSQESVVVYDNMTVEAYFHLETTEAEPQKETEEISVPTASPDAYEWLYR
jgi:hypothetical protein